MSLKQVLCVVVIILAATVVLGSAVIGGFSKSVRTSTVVAITDFNVSLTGSSASLSAYEFPQTLTGCTRSNQTSDTLTSGTDYTINEGLSETAGTLTLLNGDYNNSLINCSSLTYLEDSDAQGSADLFNVALVIFATFISIIVLSLVGKTVIEMFKND